MSEAKWALSYTEPGYYTNLPQESLDNPYQPTVLPSLAHILTGVNMPSLTTVSRVHKGLIRIVALR